MKEIHIHIDLGLVRENVKDAMYDFGTTHGENAEMRAILQDGASNVAVTRCIQNALSEALIFMADYNPRTDEEASNYLLDGTEIGIVLNMPSNYDDSMDYVVAQQLHQVLVNGAMIEWLDITDQRSMKDYSKDYVEKKQQSLANIVSALSKRNYPARKSNDTTVLTHTNVTLQ